METPFALLWFAAKSAARALSSGGAWDPKAEIGPALAHDFKKQLQEITEASHDELKSAIKEVVQRVAGSEPQPVRRALAEYLSRVPAGIRKKFARGDDPAGTTVPPDLNVRGPEDLLLLLPPLKESPAKAARKVQEPSDGPVRVTLTVTAGVNLGNSYAFVGHDTFLVGRGPKAHFRLPAADRFFSRIHFMVEVNPPRCSLMDMGSRNGTHVNGKRVAGAVELKDGDKVKAGRTIFQVRLEELTQEFPLPERQLALEAPIQKPAPPPKAQPSIGRCLVCNAGVKDKAIALCPACHNLAAKEKQPIPGYRIVRELGRGGMGVVHLALREADRTVVALKTIMPTQAGSATQVNRFLREARILEQLDHPNIVRFRDMGAEGDLLYFAMDFVPGIDASKWVKKEGPVSVERAVGWIGRLLQALDYAHAKGFVHRDIKPANLLVVEDAGKENVLLADFGLARVYQASPLSGLTLRGDIAGTVAYMAPEQITQFRDVRPAADQYSAAASLYHLLTGKLTFDLPHQSAQQILMVLSDEPIPILERRPDLPAALSQAIHRALAKDPAQRFADARAFRQALVTACA